MRKIREIKRLCKCDSPVAKPTKERPRPNFCEECYEELNGRRAIRAPDHNKNSSMNNLAYRQRAKKKS